MALIPFPDAARNSLRQPPRLTPAEREVLALLCAGLSNKEIAAALGKATPTVKNQVESCLRKYAVPSRTRLMAVVHGVSTAVEEAAVSCGVRTGGTT